MTKNKADNQLVSFPAAIVEEFGKSLPAPIVFSESKNETSMIKKEKTKFVEGPKRDVTQFIKIDRMDGEDLLVAIPSATEVPSNKWKLKKSYGIAGFILVAILSVLIGIIVSVLPKNQINLDNCKSLLINYS